MNARNTAAKERGDCMTCLTRPVAIKLIIYKGKVVETHQLSVCWDCLRVARSQYRGRNGR